jgi:hypothetical protein
MPSIPLPEKQIGLAQPPAILSRESLFGQRTGYDGMDTSHLAILQPDFDPSGMVRGTGKEILDDPFRQRAAALIFFQHNGHSQAGMNIFSVLTVHCLSLLEAD